jgi:hypothetical protein
MRTLERDDRLRQEVRRGDARRDDGQGPGYSLTELADTPGCLRKKRVGAEHVIREEFSGGSQVPTSGSPHDEFCPRLSLNSSDVLGDGWLTDAQLPRSR